MKVVIVAGGSLSPAFLKRFLAEHAADFVIAADRGLDCLIRAGGAPDLVLGDYDSTGMREKVETLRAHGIPVETYPCEKDFSDLESAMRIAVKKIEEARGSYKNVIGQEPPGDTSRITVLGATGGRLDHFFAAVYNLTIALDAGISAQIVDEQNVIELKNRSFVLKRDEVFGKYISFFPLGEDIPDITLYGFKYPLTHGALTHSSASLGLSNEITEGEAEVIFRGGPLLCIYSKDRTRQSA